jgi:hypothetical protein
MQTMLAHSAKLSAIDSVETMSRQSLLEHYVAAANW